MKYLKLDARHDECHGLARALVGSPVVDDDCNEHRKLSAIEFSKGDYSFGLFYPEGKFRGCIFWEQAILLPLDTLKLCPFVCMREGLNVKMVAYIPCEGYSIDRGVRLSTGLIAELGVNIDEAQFTLDLENLPKGAEVVEL